MTLTIPEIEMHPRHVLGVLDLAGSFIMLWASQRITSHAGFITRQARWALFRRATYSALAVALFGLGVLRFANTDGTSIESAFQALLLGGLMLFPLMRAAGLVTQDIFLGNEVRSELFLTMPRISPGRMRAHAEEAKLQASDFAAANTDASQKLLGIAAAYDGLARVAAEERSLTS